MSYSHETIAKLISAEYEKSGVKGEQYIKKIIQIPVTIQQWNINDVKGLVENLCCSLLMDPSGREGKATVSGTREKGLGVIHKIRSKCKALLEEVEFSESPTEEEVSPSIIRNNPIIIIRCRIC